MIGVRPEEIADDSISNDEEKQRLFANIRSRTKRLDYDVHLSLAASWGPAKPDEHVARLRKALQGVDDRIRDVPPDAPEARGSLTARGRVSPAVPPGRGVRRGLSRTGVVCPGSSGAGRVPAG